MNHWTKKILWILAGVIIIFIILPFLRPFTIPPSIDENKLVEIRHSNITGYKHQKVSFKMKADVIYTGKNLNLFEAENVHSGEFFNEKGETLISQIQAKRINIDTLSQTFIAYQNILGKFLKRNIELDLIHAAEKSKNIEISADELRYLGSNKKTFLEKNVVIKQGDAYIYPTKGVEIDHDQNIAYIHDGYKMQSREFTITGKKMVIYIDEEYSEMTEGVSGYRKGGVSSSNVTDRQKEFKSKDAYLTCEKMIYKNVSENEIITVEGKVVIQQDQKTIIADQGVYDKKTGIFELKKNVLIDCKTLEWALKKKNMTNNEFKKTIKQQTKINSDYLRMDENNNNAFMKGNIKITQKDKTATCKELSYEDSKGWLILKGDVVVIKETKDKLKCSELILDTEKEEFLAKSNVKTELTLKKKKEK